GRGVAAGVASAVGRGRAHALVLGLRRVHPVLLALADGVVIDIRAAGIPHGVRTLLERAHDPASWSVQAPRAAAGTTRPAPICCRARPGPASRLGDPGDLGWDGRRAPSGSGRWRMGW